MSELKEVKAEDTQSEDKKVTKLKTIVTLNFEARSAIQKGKAVFNKKQEGDKVVDDLTSPVYDRNDIETLIIFLNSVDVAKLKLEQERQLLMCSDKVKERWKAEDFNCEIQFSVKEAAFLQKILEDVKGNMRDEAVFSTYHSKTKFALLDQLED